MNSLFGFLLVGLVFFFWFFGVFLVFFCFFQDVWELECWISPGVLQQTERFFFYFFFAVVPRNLISKCLLGILELG